VPILPDMTTVQPDRHCTYEKCKRPTQSSQFIQIDGASKAGGKDWKPLHGKVICNACYIQYFKRGTLTRTQNQGKALPEASRHCSYDGCKKPHESSRFYEIDGESTAGGQDWKPVGGRILCQACYDRYRAKGSLDKGPGNSAPTVKRCSYEGCKRPTESRQFIQIDPDSQAGTQNWKQLAGKVLCHTCYYHYLRSGSLERSKARQPHAPSGSGSKTATAVSSSPAAPAPAPALAPAPAAPAPAPAPALAAPAPSSIANTLPLVVIAPVAVQPTGAGLNSLIALSSMPSLSSLSEVGVRRPTPVPQPVPTPLQPMAVPAMPAPPPEPSQTAVAATIADAIKRTPSGPGSETSSTPPGGTVHSRRGSLDIRRGSLEANHQAAVMAAAVAAMAAKRLAEGAKSQSEVEAKAKRQKTSEGKDAVAAE